MKEKKITFNGMILIINNKPVDYADFKSLFIKDTYNDFADCVFNLEFNDNKLLIELEYGNPLPRKSYVINQDTKEKENNTRKENQFEPKICYCIIDFKTSYLWISNMTLKGKLKELFESILKTENIVIKDVYNEDDFIKLLYKIDELKFSAAPSLLIESKTISEALCNDIYGYEANQATLTFNFDNKIIKYKLLQKIKALLNQRHTTLRNVVISGRDNKNIGMLFNSNSFIRKIELSASIDEQRNFHKEDIYTKINLRLNEENKVHNR